MQVEKFKISFVLVFEFLIQKIIKKIGKIYFIKN
jgi:hypothetical protein